MISRPARLVLLGNPTAHSLSPAIQNAALRFMRIPLTYGALNVSIEEFDSTIERLVDERVAGNVTIPHKRRMAEQCGRLTPHAQRASAVNTFWVDADGILSGDCTDVGGFDALAREVIGDSPPTGARVAVLGAGGAASAVLTALEHWPAGDVTLWNRAEGPAESLASRFGIISRIASSPEEAARDASVIVNATSIGMLDDSQPIDVAVLPAGAAVLDLVYRRGGTSWVRGARERGLRASDGLPMLLEQGALAFERWFAMPAPRDVMRDAVAHQPSAVGHRLYGT